MSPLSKEEREGILRMLDRFSGDARPIDELLRRALEAEQYWREVVRGVADPWNPYQECSFCGGDTHDTNCPWLQAQP